MNDIAIHPLTPDRWPDLETVFGPQGAYAGCWCMWPRMRSKDFATSTGKKNKAALKRIVHSQQPPGLLAYVDGRSAAWVSLDPRERYARLQHGRVWKPLDDTPVWSIICFVVSKGYRRQGMTSKLLAGAIDYARENGATTLEAYPVEPEGALTGDGGYTGIRSVFERARFSEAGRMFNGRPVMRLGL